MSVKLLTEHHLEFLSLQGDCTSSFESTLFKMSHCWQSRATAHIFVRSPLVAAETLNADLETISRWAVTRLVTYNPNKSVALLLSRKVSQLLYPPFFIENTTINEVEANKHLGLYISNECSWHQYINYIKEKALTKINIMRRLKYKLDRKLLESVYTFL